MDNQGLGTLDATDELAEQLERIGTQILNASRAELYFGMRFLDVALSSFDYQMNTEVHHLERTEEISFIIRNYWVECTEEIEFRLIGDICIWYIIAFFVIS